MLWTKENTYREDPFELEKDFEAAVIEVSDSLFGKSRIYLDVKKKIGKKGKTRNIPDAYLIDLSSKKSPTLYVLENEIEKHASLKHIAVQILEFSLSFESSHQKVKSIIKDALTANSNALKQCEDYAKENGFENIDYLLERMIYPSHGPNAGFNAMVVIDQISDELETVLIHKFHFPVEVLSLQRFIDKSGKKIYQFEPFLEGVAETAPTDAGEEREPTATIDPSDIDTIIVPAHEDGFQETFLGRNCWHAIRMRSIMISRLKYIAAYQVSPVSAITHIAKVSKIEPFENTNKYIVYFDGPAKEISPIALVPKEKKGRVNAPQAPRYANREQLEKAKTLDDVF